MAGRREGKPQGHGALAVLGQSAEETLGDREALAVPVGACPFHEEPEVALVGSKLAQRNEKRNC